MRLHCKISLAILFALFTLFGCLLNMHVVVAQTNDALSKLQLANTTIEQSFSAVLEAEKAGANVTSLLVRLNGVADILAKDEVGYRNGNESAAVVNLNVVTSVAADVKLEAINAGAAATTIADRALWTSIAVSVIGGLGVPLALLLVWRRFREKPP